MINRQALARLVAELERLGADSVRLVHGRKHPHLRFTVRGRICRYYLSKTPSDWRTANNALAGLRRLARAPEPRP